MTTKARVRMGVDGSKDSGIDISNRSLDSASSGLWSPQVAHLFPRAFDGRRPAKGCQVSSRSRVEYWQV